MECYFEFIRLVEGVLAGRCILSLFLGVLGLVVSAGEGRFAISAGEH